MATFASILTWFPLIIERNINAFYPQLSNTIFTTHVLRTMLLMCLANSLINPIIYAMRLPELREGITKIIFRRAPNSSNQGDSPLRNLWFIFQTIRIIQQIILSSHYRYIIRPRGAGNPKKLLAEGCLDKTSNLQAVLKGILLSKGRIDATIGMVWK